MFAPFYYQIVIFRNGKEIYREKRSLTGQRLYELNRDVTYTSFLRLLDRWNREGLIGASKSGIVYVYTTTTTTTTTTQKGEVT